MVAVTMKMRAFLIHFFRLYGLTSLKTANLEEIGVKILKIKIFKKI
jgi:hypothetical protein